jgi:hypothetical protein
MALAPANIGVAHLVVTRHIDIILHYAELFEAPDELIEQSSKDLVTEAARVLALIVAGLSGEVGEIR